MYISLTKKYENQWKSNSDVTSWSMMAELKKQAACRVEGRRFLWGVTTFWGHIRHSHAENHHVAKCWGKIIHRKIREKPWKKHDFFCCQPWLLRRAGGEARRSSFRLGLHRPNPKRCDSFVSPPEISPHAARQVNDWFWHVLTHLGRDVAPVVDRAMSKQAERNPVPTDL